MSKSLGPITELFQEYALYGDFCLTKKGTLLGAVEIDGRDPDGLTRDDFIALAMINRSIYLNMPEAVSSVTQYYLHFEGAQIRLKDRSNPVSHYLSKNRQRYLNGKRLTGAKIVHFFEVEPDENLTDIGLLTLCKHLVLAGQNKQSRLIVGKYLSAGNAIIAYANDLERQRDQLREVLLDAKGRYDTLFNARLLKKGELWAFCRFLANMDPALLFDAVGEAVPAEQWDVLLAEGDCYPVSVANQDYLKFQRLENHYARFLSVTRYGEAETSPALWSAHAQSATRQKGNYAIMTRFSPLSKIRQAMLFGAKKRELKRKNMSMAQVFSIFGNQAQGQTNGDRYANLKPDIKEKMLEIEKAEGLNEKWGDTQAAVLVFGQNPEAINATARDLRKSMLQAGISLVAESVNLPEAYRAFMPAGRQFSVRNMTANCSQFGAASLIYRSAEGQATVADLDGEEAQYIFNCPDGTLFHYCPFVGGKGVVIGVGPIRSGKSFTKNTIASHFTKYGGFYRAIDIDPGTETLAKFFRQDGAIFRIGQGDRGFNNFAVAAGPDDNRFIMHQKQLVIEMLKSNENEKLRSLESYEQQQLDQAIIATLKLPVHLRRLSTMVNHCPQELQQKLNRWYGKGMFASLFDQENDAIGSLDKPVVAFNLSGVKDDPTRLPLAMSEVTYRVTRMFEDPAFRHLPKYLDIDEAHALLGIRYMREYIIRSVRTWGKWKAGVGLWSQDPNEFRRIEDWTALRSAASTLFFMADPTADAALYRETFILTDGEIEAIRRLRPKKEAYIIQREIGVSKTVLVEVEPEQHVINTSRPDEAVLRDRLIAEHGIEEGIRKAVEALNLEPQ
jgi:type IV secretion system protein VirB4